MGLPIPFSNPATYAGHSGVDYGGHAGEPFPASAPGYVVTLGRNERGGYYIWVQYDNGPLVGYHHMNSHVGCPAAGTRFSYGQRLGYVGWSGHVVPPGRAGAHLHSEVSGYATTDGYWKFFDRNKVVGSGSGAGSGGSTPAPKPTPNDEEDDMINVQMNNNKYGVAKQFITHYNDTRQSTVAAQRYGGFHDFGNGNANSDAFKNFMALLDANGIPRPVMGGDGTILNPQANSNKGAHVANGTWSREREILAAIAKK